MSRKNRVSIPGSERAALPGARAVGAPHPDERLDVTLLVRPRSAATGFPSVGELGATPLQARKYISREEFSATHGADPGDLDKIKEFAHDHNLTVVEVS